MHAAMLGLEVIHRPLRAANGYWYPDHDLIVIKSGMRALHDRSALAHEISHALLGHRDDRPKHEIAADRYASELLIEPRECERAMHAAPDLPTLAAELQVSQRIMQTWLDRHRAA